MNTTPDALPCFIEKKNIDLFEKYGVLSKSETHARYVAKSEQYVKHVNIEVNTMVYMARHLYLPALFTYSGDIAQTVIAVIRSGVTGSKSACAFNIKNRILQVVDKATSHKSFNESCRGEVFERINDVDEFVGFVLSLFYNLVGKLLVVLSSAVLLGFYYLGAGVVLPLAVLTLIVFLVKALSRSYPLT